MNYLEEIKKATWMINTFINNTEETFDLTIFFVFWLRITIIALVLQLIWYFNTSWVSNIGNLVLELIFWFRIIKCGWFCILGIIATNFLNIGTGRAIGEKYATTVAYVGTHFFPKLLEGSVSHSTACSTLISSKKHAPIKWERDWRFYGKCLWYCRWPSELREVWV